MLLTHITARKSSFPDLTTSPPVSPAVRQQHAMGMGATDPPRSINLSACVPSSPSWPPAGRQRGTAAVVVRRLQLAARDAIPGVGWCGHRAWRKLLRRLAQETRCVCSPSTTAASRSRPITFGYDAASYAKNFDDERRPAPYGAVVVASAGDKSAGC